jgi:hypothetical protein
MPRTLSPDVERIRVLYTAIHLSAPEQVSYSYRLNGLEPKWVPAGARREINYNTPKHGNYRFFVRAELPGRAVHRSTRMLRCAAALL